MNHFGALRSKVSGYMGKKQVHLKPLGDTKTGRSGARLLTYWNLKAFLLKYFFRKISCICKISFNWCYSRISHVFKSAVNEQLIFDFGRMLDDFDKMISSFPIIFFQNISFWILAILRDTLSNFEVRTKNVRCYKRSSQWVKLPCCRTGFVKLF